MMNAQDINELFNNIHKSTDSDIVTQPVTIDGLNRIVLIFKDNFGLAHVLVEARERVILILMK